MVPEEASDYERDYRWALMERGTSVGFRRLQRKIYAVAAELGVDDSWATALSCIALVETSQRPAPLRAAEWALNWTFRIAHTKRRLTCGPFQMYDAPFPTHIAAVQALQTLTTAIPVAAYSPKEHIDATARLWFGSTHPEPGAQWSYSCALFIAHDALRQINHLAGATTKGNVGSSQLRV